MPRADDRAYSRSCIALVVLGIGMVYRGQACTIRHLQNSQWKIERISIQQPHLLLFSELPENLAVPSILHEVAPAATQDRIFGLVGHCTPLETKACVDRDAQHVEIPAR